MTKNWQKVASVRRENKWFYTGRVNGVQYWIVENNHNRKWFFDSYRGKSCMDYDSPEEAAKDIERIENGRSLVPLA